MISPPPELPKRIQLSRAKGWKMPLNTVRATRPGPLGNPFPVSVFGHDQAVALHRTWLETETAEKLGYVGADAQRLNAMRAAVLAHLPSVRGQNLACWCAEPAPYERDRCHCAVLLEIANG